MMLKSSMLTNLVLTNTTLEPMVTLFAASLYMAKFLAHALAEQVLLVQSIKTTTF